MSTEEGCCHVFAAKYDGAEEIKAEMAGPGLLIQRAVGRHLLDRCHGHCVEMPCVMVVTLFQVLAGKPTKEDS